MIIQRVLNKIYSICRKHYFRNETGCACEKLNIHGPIYLINKNIICGSNVTIYQNVTFWGDGPIVIGDNVDIGIGTILYSSKNGGGIYIGDGTIIAGQCYIIDMDHGIKKSIPISKQINTVDKIEIGTDVWVGAGCKILKGSVIHDGAIIGAMALVKGEIAANGIAIGNPARIVKYRK